MTNREDRSWFIFGHRFGEHKIVCSVQPGWLCRIIADLVVWLYIIYHICILPFSTQDTYRILAYLAGKCFRCVSLYVSQ